MVYMLYYATHISQLYIVHASVLQMEPQIKNQIKIYCIFRGYKRVLKNKTKQTKYEKILIIRSRQENTQVQPQKATSLIKQLNAFPASESEKTTA